MPTKPPAPGFVSLVFEISRLYRLSFGRRAQHLKLTQPQSLALAAIAREPGLTQASLAEKLEVHPVTVTQLIDRLERSGWVSREAHENDRRAFRLHLTEQADPILSKLWALAREARAEAMRGLSEQEQQQLESLLLRVKANLLAEDASPRTRTRAG